MGGWQDTVGTALLGNKQEASGLLYPTLYCLPQQKSHEGQNQELWPQAPLPVVGRGAAWQTGCWASHIKADRREGPRVLSA